MPKLLSKSKYLNGLQCPKLLWVAINEPRRLPQPDDATQHVFDQGHLVGQLAKKLYPGGIDVPDEDFRENLKLTRDLLKKRVTLFEAGLLVTRIYSRLDMLVPVNNNEWDIVEVKSSTSVKEVNLHDVSFQKMVCEQAGLKIRKCFLAHINNEYLRRGDLVPEELFTVEDVTEQASMIAYGIGDRVNSMLAIMDADTCPECQIGPHCHDPYDCGLVDTECWANLPEDNVFTLYYGGKKSFDLLRNGIVRVKDIPSTYTLNDKQRIQRTCEIQRIPHIDPAAISEFLSCLEYPLYFLDFETFAPAVPLYDNSRPWQNVPFQFSLHIKSLEGAPLKHHSFLADGKGDPRPELLASLRQAIGDQGTILAYNKSFEANVLKELGAAFPEHALWTEGIAGRLVDLLVPFRSFHYYHPDQHGSASLKSVLPALCSRGYDGMEIGNGVDASLAFMKIVSSTLSAHEVAEVRDNLERYCGLDTEGMVEIVERLTTIIFT